MSDRYYGDYKIIQSERLNENEELVIGYNKNNPVAEYRYVCWYYYEPKDYYFWGHYFETLENAQNDLKIRKKELFDTIDIIKNFKKN